MRMDSQSALDPNDAGVKRLRRPNHKDIDIERNPSQVATEWYHEHAAPESCAFYFWLCYLLIFYELWFVFRSFLRFQQSPFLLLQSHTADKCYALRPGTSRVFRACLQTSHCRQFQCNHILACKWNHFDSPWNTGHYWLLIQREALLVLVNWNHLERVSWCPFKIRCT